MKLKSLDEFFSVTFLDPVSDCLDDISPAVVASAAGTPECYILYTDDLHFKSVYSTPVPVIPSAASPVVTGDDARIVAGVGTAKVASVVEQLWV